MSQNLLAISQAQFGNYLRRRRSRLRALTTLSVGGLSECRDVARGAALALALRLLVDGSRQFRERGDLRFGLHAEWLLMMRAGILYI